MASVEAAGCFFHVQQSQPLVAPKLDVPLAKDGPVRNGGNTSGITDLRRKEKKVMGQL